MKSLISEPDVARGLRVRCAVFLFKRSNGAPEIMCPRPELLGDGDGVSRGCCNLSACCAGNDFIMQLDILILIDSDINSFRPTVYSFAGTLVNGSWDLLGVHSSLLHCPTLPAKKSVLSRSLFYRSSCEVICSMFYSTTFNVLCYLFHCLSYFVLINIVHGKVPCLQDHSATNSWQCWAI